MQDAIEWYRRARQGAREFFPADPRLATSLNILLMEVDLERDRGKAIQQRTLQGFTDLRGVWNELYAVAVAVRAELAFEQYDSRAVVQFLVRTIEDVRMAGARSLGIYVSALLAYYLVKGGRVEEAGEVWANHALPCDRSELLDLNGQSWRKMEALSSARVMLLAEQGDLGGARELVDALCSTASERGMTRTALRGLGLSIAVAHRAGDEERALSRLVEFLRLTLKVDYVRPLVSQGKTSRTLLRRLLRTNLDADLHQAAENDAGASRRAVHRLFGVHFARAGRTGRSPPRPPEQGDRALAGHHRRRRALPPQEHLPQGRCLQSARRRPLRGGQGSAAVGNAAG